MRRTLFAATVGLWLAVGSATAADGPFQYKPIDTNTLLVKPTDQAAGFFSGVSRTLSRVAAGTIEENGFVRTINNVFGTKKQAPASQVNGLPAPSLYPSTKYQNSFQPVMPTSQQYQR